MTPIRVFVGGTAEHDLPTRVLEYSIRRRLVEPERLDFHRLWDVPIPIPEPRDPKNRPRTSFSLQRFLIPEACEFRGIALYLDSDMLVLGDLGDLFERPFPDGAQILCPEQSWQTAVMLIDCRVGWRIEALVRELNADRLTYRELMNLTRPEITGRMERTIPSVWNDTDRFRHETRLLHYTNMAQQPWLNALHPFGKLWENELRAALKDGAITADQVQQSIRRRWVRPSLSSIIDQPAPYDDREFVPPNDLRS